MAKLIVSEHRRVEYAPALQVNSVGSDKEACANAAQNGLAACTMVGIGHLTDQQLPPPTRVR
ncbi:hypothetical protein [Stenotrophomonas maltophilia]|uniref:hypothetical protein n=1 Tax=Stenotrophomonas maltophilia TaxID=40324 RepID=UPI0015DDDF0E|nr:hypothetical protein [Stenotrophomonas maltophilia]